MNENPPSQPAHPPSPIAPGSPPLQMQGGLPPEILAQILASNGQIPVGGIQLTLPGIVQQQSQHWQAPYPPPDAVERYEVVLPGTFNRLITMAENLQNAQIVQSNNGIQYSRDDVRRGQWLGAATTAFAMLSAIICVWLKEPWVAAAFLSVPVMAVAKALVDASSKNQLSKTIVEKAVTGTKP